MNAAKEISSLVVENYNSKFSQPRSKSPKKKAKKPLDDNFDIDTDAIDDIVNGEDSDDSVQKVPRKRKRGEGSCALFIPAFCLTSSASNSSVSF
jgi:hypothetical protein